MKFLSFFELSVANAARASRWHRTKDGTKAWSLSDWATATAGEVGEACNLIKKMNRLRDGLAGNTVEDADMDALKRKLGHELADAVIYIDLLAQAAGLSLDDCVRDKFNIVSVRNGFPERL